MMKFEDQVLQMKGLAEHLIKYSFPIVSPIEEEIISCLKQRDIVVDGYEITLYFNKCQYLNMSMETIQIFGRQFTFLPFSLLCKIVRHFLGTEKIGFTEYTHNNNQSHRTVYIWTLYRDLNGMPIDNPFWDRNQKYNYEGLDYFMVDKAKMNIF